MLLWGRCIILSFVFGGGGMFHQNKGGGFADSIPGDASLVS